MTIGLGSYIYSKTRYRSDDDTLPVGGLVIGESGDSYYVVNLYRRTVEYFTIQADDAATGQHGGQINPAVIRDVLTGIARDVIKHGDPVKHLAAQTVLGRALDQRTPRAG